MHEIEVKFRTDSVTHVLHALQDLGCSFSPVHIHTDTVYAKKVGSLADFLSNSVYIRIREENNAPVLLTVKKPLRRDVLTKQEEEVEVNNYVKAHAMLSIMGYRKAVTIKKTRQTTRYQEITVCLDEVLSLGSFVELEIMGDGDDVSSRKALIELAKRIGLEKVNEVKEGYDVLMMKKEWEVTCS